MLEEINENNVTPNFDIFIFSFLKIKSRIISNEQQAIVIPETNEKHTRTDSKTKSFKPMFLVLIDLKYKFKMKSIIIAS